MRRHGIVLGLLLLLQGSAVRAEEVEFVQVWRAVAQRSDTFKASQFEITAAQGFADRMARHWLPQVYVDARVTQSNDPGAAFFALLQQRAIVASDFNPTSVNHPGDFLSSRGTLGVNWPLFEGGGQSAEASAAEHLLKAQQHKANRHNIAQYSEVARHFATMGILVEQRQQLHAITAKVDRLISTYQVGQKANPMGYSGLLGLQSLRNRLQALENHYVAKTLASQEQLKALGFTKTDNWQAQFDGVIAFVERYLPSATGQSSALKSLDEQTAANRQATTKARSAYLPKVGLFAESYLFSGERDLDGGYNAGLYLNWQLLAPQTYGRLAETKAQSQAAEFYLRAATIQEQNAIVESDAMLRALGESLQLLQDNQRLMNEQVGVTETLLRNGTINPLQFVEVMARRTDLTQTQTENKLLYLTTAAQRAENSGFVIPDHVVGSL